MRQCLVIFCFFCLKSTFADFQWNENCKQAYQLNIELKFDRAHTILEKKKENPGNSLVYFIENYSEYLKFK